jgi:hypothetical protein
MSKHKDYDVSLISVGVIDAELHFGPFSYYWWITCNKKTEFLVPIRLHMKTMTFLKGYNFVITVVKGNKEHSECPGYLCDCGEFFTEEPSNSSTNAISTVYQKMFRNKTKFSGPQIMGFEKPAIYEKLLEGVLFRPYLVDLELVHVSVFEIAKSKNNEWGYAGVGFKSSFAFELEKQRCLFIQEFEEELCKVTIIQKKQIEKIYYESTPDLVWEKIFSEQKRTAKLVELMKLTGKTLYGIENNLTQKLIHDASTCSLNEWNDDIIEKVFSYHLKRRTSIHVDWHNFLRKWQEQGTIIELYSDLKQSYPTNYQLSERELNAWRIMLRSIGCHNITFLKQESKVKKNKKNYFK